MTSSSPPTNSEIGKAGWILIHSTAAHYPDFPTSKEKEAATNFMNSIASLYPCLSCRSHFSDYLKKHSPDVSSREKFMLWACSAHNHVNLKTGKNVFPCDMELLRKRWNPSRSGKDSKSMSNEKIILDRSETDEETKFTQNQTNISMEKASTSSESPPACTQSTSTVDELMGKASPTITKFKYKYNFKYDDASKNDIEERGETSDRNVLLQAIEGIKIAEKHGKKRGGENI